MEKRWVCVPPDYREALFLVRQQFLDQRTQIGDHAFVRR
jgi:hypothetical protein